jgi:hypothetical protein
MAGFLPTVCRQSQQRQISSRGHPLPVKFDPDVQLPDPVAEIQFGTDPYPSAYINEGLFGLMRLKWKDSYDEFTLTLARKLVEMAKRRSSSERSSCS